MSFRKKLAVLGVLTAAIIPMGTPTAYAEHYELQVNGTTYDSVTWDYCRIAIQSGVYLTAAYANISGGDCRQYSVNVKYFHNGRDAWTGWSDFATRGRVAGISGPAYSEIRCVAVKMLVPGTGKFPVHIYCK